MEYSNELLLKMLDIALGAMNENELCSYCAFHCSQDCFNGNTDDYCKEGLWLGLKNMAEKKN